MDGVVSAYRLGHRNLGSNFAKPARNNRAAPTPATSEDTPLVWPGDDSKIPAGTRSDASVRDTDRDSLDDSLPLGEINPAFVDEDTNKEPTQTSASADNEELNENVSSPVSITSITQYSSNEPADVTPKTQDAVSDSSTAHQSAEQPASVTPIKHHSPTSDGDDNLEIVQSDASNSEPSPAHKTTFITLQLKHSSNISAFTATPWRPQAPPPPPPQVTDSVTPTSPEFSEDTPMGTKDSPSSPTHVSKISLPNFSSSQTLPPHPSKPAPSTPALVSTPLQPSSPAPSLPSTPVSSPPPSPVHPAPQTEPPQPSSRAPSLPGTPTPSSPGTPTPSLPGTPTPSPPRTPPTSQPGSPKPSQHGTPTPSRPVSPIPSQPGTPTPSRPVSPTPSQHGTPTPSQPDSPTPSQPGSPISSQPGTPTSSKPDELVLFQPDTPINSLPGTPTSPPKHLASQPTTSTPSPVDKPAAQPSTPVTSTKSSPVPSPVSSPLPVRPPSPISLPPLMPTTTPPSTPSSLTGKPTLLSMSTISSLSTSFSSRETVQPLSSTQDQVPSPPTSPPPPVPNEFDETKPVEVEEEIIQKEIVKKEHLVLHHEEDDTALTLVEGDPIETSKVEPLHELLALIADPDGAPIEEAQLIPVEKETQQSDMMSLPANKPPTFRTNRHSDIDARQMEPPRNARHLTGHRENSDESSDDLSNWYITPPANKGGQRGDGISPVVDRQPNVWVPYILDPISKAEFDNLPAMHKTYGELKLKLKTELGEMSKKDGDGSFILNDSISYIEFFRGLLYDDEEVLMNNQYIPFSHAVFNLFDEWLPMANTTTNRNTDKAQVMLMGRVILTNHRLILISAEQQQGAELRKLNLNSCADKAGAYQIRTMHHDTLHFRSIPLNKFHSVEMQASVGVVKSTNITGNRLSCCSCSCLPGCDVFSKRWQVQETLSTRTNSRLVTCGVILPPWDSRAALQIYMAPSVPLYHVKNFMLELQKNSPGLHPSAVPSFAGY